MGPESYADLIRYMDLAVVLSFAVFLLLGIVLVRLERHIFRLMTAEAEGSDEASVVVNPFRNGTITSTTTIASMGRTEWDELSWDDKMAIQRRKQLLNWTAAVFGALGLIAGMMKLRAGVPGYLGAFELTLIGVLFLAMGTYWIWNHLQLWKESASTVQVQMSGTSRSRGFDRLALIAAMVVVFGAFFGRIGLFVSLAVLAVLAGAMLRLF